MIAASAGALSRATGRGGGTSLPGMVLNKLEPGALARLGGGLGGGAVYISATNGKTTTARLLSACLRADDRIVTANAAGANLAGGVTAALLVRQRRQRAERRGSRRGDRGAGSRTNTATHGTTGTHGNTGARANTGTRQRMRHRWAIGAPRHIRNRHRHRGSHDEPPGCGGIGVFEVDEAALPPVAGALQPRAVVLMNLFRDQLDRYGELETIAERWSELARSLGPATTLVLNADDPALAYLGRLWTGEPTFQPHGPEGATERLSGDPAGTPASEPSPPPAPEGLNADPAGSPASEPSPPPAPEGLDADPAGSPASETSPPPAPERTGTDTPRVVLFGIDDPAVGRPDLPHAADTVRCGNCGHPLSHDLVTVGHLGHWRCDNCGLRRPRPHIRARLVNLDGLDRLTLTISGLDGADRADEASESAGAGETPEAGRGPEAAGGPEASGVPEAGRGPEASGVPEAGRGPEAGGSLEAGEAPEAAAGRVIQLTAGLGGLHNAYNVTAAVAAAAALGVPPEAIRDGIAGVQAAFGRAEQVSLDGRTLRLLLAKNPTGANENIRCVLAEPGPLSLLVVLNDRTADGRDPSWIWDVDYEPLWDRTGSVTLAGDRCWELALRFSYGGLDPARFEVRESLPEALDHAVAATPPGGVLYALPTYTALLDLRAELVRRGVTHDFWQES